MNFQILYDESQNWREQAEHFFATMSAHHVSISVRYAGGGFFVAHCENEDGLRAVLSMLLAAYQDNNAKEFHPVDVKAAWIYADEM